MPALRISVGLVVNPLIRGFRLRLEIPFRSAPSAKIFTFNSLTGFIAFQPHSTGFRSLSENNLHGFGERSHYKIRRIDLPFRVTAFHKNRGASSRLPGRNIPPAIAHHEG